MQQRLDWIDIAKGVGIILVVIGHAGRGILNAGIPDGIGLLPVMDRAIYAFHMPLFFILAGVTFGMRPPDSIQPGLTRKLWRLFFALVIWTYAFLAMRALAGSNANAGGSWQDLLVLPLPPIAHFWFLWALLINMAVFTLLRLVARRHVPDPWFWSGALAVSAVAHFTVTLPEQATPFLGHALNFSLAFTLGALIGSSPIREAVPSRSVAIVGLMLFSLGVWASAAFESSLSGVARGSVLSLFLLPSLVLLSTRYGRAGWARLVAFLGVISLAIYVMHTMFSAAFRIGLLQLGIDDLAVHLIVGVAVGLLGPLAAYLLARRTGTLRVAGLA
jgi:fucose 4-O-acetylase-like acetyltransferase